MSEKPYEMTQCLIERPIKEGAYALEISWIPSGRAKVGNKIKIKDYPGVWVVRECYSTEMSDVLTEGSTDWKRHRKATDV